MQKKAFRFASVSLFAALILGAIAMFPQPAHAQSEGYDCVTEGADDLLCLALPGGTTSVEDQILANSKMRAPRKFVRPMKKLSMLTEEDLTASASLETEFDREALLSPATIAEQRSQVKPLAEVEALRLSQQVQDLNIFLNLTQRTGGAAGTGVISAGQQ